MPVIIRLDGKAFHTLTKNCDKPFDAALQATMEGTAQALCKAIQGAKCAYTQSDEISILLTDFDKLTTDGWFDYNLQKIVSISAGMASAYFSCIWNGDKRGIFDSRAFNIPKEEVCNYFIWRQQDWFRNSIQMLSQAHYSHKELKNKNIKDMHEMLYKKGVNWNNLKPVWKNGTFIHYNDDELRWMPEYNLIFIKNRDIIEKHLEPLEI